MTMECRHYYNSVGDIFQLLLPSITFICRKRNKQAALVLLSLKFISESVFYDTQQRFLFPVLKQAWKNEQQMVRQELVNKGAINLNGDGRCDSPGRTANFGTYTMDNDSCGVQCGPGFRGHFL